MLGFTGYIIDSPNVYGSARVRGWARTSRHIHAIACHHKTKHIEHRQGFIQNDPADDGGPAPARRAAEELGAQFVFQSRLLSAHPSFERIELAQGRTNTGSIKLVCAAEVLDSSLVRIAPLWL